MTAMTSTKPNIIYFNPFSFSISLVILNKEYRKNQLKFDKNKKGMLFEVKKCSTFYKQANQLNSSVNYQTIVITIHSNIE
jgi:hypothetical protein